MRKLLTLIVATALLVGCSTFERLGITEDIVKTGVKIALARHDLEGAVTDAQLSEIVAIVKAEQRLQEIGEEIAEDARVQAKIESIVDKYVVDGAVVVPGKNQPAANIDEANYDEFTWKYGGEDFSKAQYDGSVIVRLVDIGKNDIYYLWERNLSNWGLAWAQADAVACAFLLNKDGQWVGGKFDWTSSSRTDRDFGHFTNYKGWSLADIPNPTQMAFVVVEDGGRRRSNVITGTWTR